MKIEDIITNSREPGEYIYHATRFDDLKEGLSSIKEKGLLKAKEALYGPGVYMGYNPQECLCQVSCKESRVLEARWQSIRVLYGADPTNPASMPDSYKLQNVAEGLRKIQKLGVSNIRSGLKDENFYQVAANDAVILRADWKKIKEMYGDDIQMESNTVVVPDTIPASLLEVEYKPSQWTSINEAIEKLK
tara:strand:- start:141 stop:710 length:570 start_codon:yes stop_codon:yes gene_type:complete